MFFWKLRLSWIAFFFSFFFWKQFFKKKSLNKWMIRLLQFLKRLPSFTDYLFFINRFNSHETIKLTTAPIIAKTTVLSTSAEAIVGTILNKVPDVVPIDKLWLVSISLLWIYFRVLLWCFTCWLLPFKLFFRLNC